MEYTTQSLARLAKVSARTLRYYDEIGLLKPARKTAGGYRIYGRNEVDRLQQILLYKSMGLELDTIARMLNDPGYDAVEVMERHLSELKRRQEQLADMIACVSETVSCLKGEKTMSDKEKFEMFKADMIRKNEEKYGAEARKKYGDEAVDFSNRKIKGADEQELNRVQELSEQINEALRQACAQGDPAGEAAQRACALHQQWIRFFWKQYSPRAHMGLCRMYLQDERFYAYYEQVAPKAADLLCQAMEIYLKEEMK